MANKEYILAEFKNPSDLLHAANECSNKGYKVFETYSPFPIHGMDDAMRLKPSNLAWIVLAGGTFGLVGGFGLQTWVSAFAYKIIISGKPFFSYPAFVPVTFEIMVLFSAFATVFGMFFLINFHSFIFLSLKVQTLERLHVVVSFYLYILQISCMIKSLQNLS